MLPSGLPEFVDDSESLSRFLTSSGQFNSIMVKPAAFLPNPKDGETSVFRVGIDAPEELWITAREAALGDRSLHGAAIVTAGNVRSAQLDVIASEPPPKHAAIVGWPWLEDDAEMQKAMQKELALLIAQRAELQRP